MKTDKDLMKQIIYFDIADEQRDGNGWNVIALNDDDSIAIRFTTQRNAEEWCTANDFSFTKQETTT